MPRARLFVLLLITSCSQAQPIASLGDVDVVRVSEQLMAGGAQFRLNVQLANRATVGKRVRLNVGLAFINADQKKPLESTVKELTVELRPKARRKLLVDIEVPRSWRTGPRLRLRMSSRQPLIELLSVEDLAATET